MCPSNNDVWSCAKNAPRHDFRSRAHCWSHWCTFVSSILLNTYPHSFFRRFLQLPTLHSLYSIHQTDLLHNNSMPSPNERAIIREVWAENLDQEMALLRDLVDQYPYLAMVRFNDSSDMVSSTNALRHNIKMAGVDMYTSWMLIIRIPSSLVLWLDPLVTIETWF